MAIVCPRLKPDGSIPTCSECVDCSVPDSATDISLFASDDVPKNGSIIFNNILLAGNPYVVTVSNPPKNGGGSKVRIAISGSAPDTYRVIQIQRHSSTERLYYWATGNNKGKGVVCETDIIWPKNSLNQVVDVKEWDSVPADKCF